MRWMREEVRHQKYRYDPRSPDWVELALARHLGLDPRADRKMPYYGHGMPTALSKFARTFTAPVVVSIWLSSLPPGRLRAF
jgi:hypothetical protein